MCVIAIKYFEKEGWVGVKNRDRNYKPTIKIKQSYRGGLERMLLWDDDTKYTEGVNEYGIGIVSSAVATKKDEKEGDKVSPETFYSPDGKKIRTALLEKTLDKVVDKLIELQLNGNTFIYTKDNCVILESGVNIDEEFVFDKSTLKKDEFAVRTNHGIKFKWLGYQSGIDDEQDYSRKSTISRYDISVKLIKDVSTPSDLFDAVSDSSTEKDPQMNPLRVYTGKKDELFTTGQIMIIPKLHQLTYRPIECDMDFDWTKLNEPKSKTFFEIVSVRRLTNESDDLTSFKTFYLNH